MEKSREEEKKKKTSTQASTLAAVAAVGQAHPPGAGVEKGPFVPQGG